MRGIGSFLTLLILFIAAAGFLLAQNVYLRQERDRSVQAQLAAEAQVAALSGQVNALRGEIARLQNELAAVRGERDGLTARVAQLEGHIAALQAELQRALAEVQRLARSEATAAKIAPAAAGPPRSRPANLDLALAVMAAGALLLALALVGLLLSLPPGRNRR